jgi:hypothetical protein
LAILAASGGIQRDHLFLFYIASALSIAAIAIVPRPEGPSILNFIRASYPLFLLVLFYYVAGAQIRILELSAHDNFFNALEINLLGVYPTIALQQIMEIWLNELSYILYCLGFVVPVLAIAMLYNKWHLRLYYNFILALEIGCCVCLIISSSLPVGGPEKALQNMYYLGIYGSNFVEIVSYLINSYFVSYDSFPAIYFCIIIISSFYLWDFGKFYVVITFIALISVFWGGIYLRYHYLLDGLAALIIAFLAVAIASYTLYRSNAKQT